MNTSDLISRLKARRIANAGAGEIFIPDDLCMEAATALETAHRRIEELKAIVERVREIAITNNSAAGKLLAIESALEAMRPEGDALEQLQAENERLREGLTRIRDRCVALRKGTDDWFDLVEIEAVCLPLLQPKEQQP